MNDTIEWCEAIENDAFVDSLFKMTGNQSHALFTLLYFIVGGS
jgi:hypothetical protein